MKRLIILDRDGVINHDSDEYIKSPQEWLPIDGSLEAIARLNYSGYHVAVATNQSGIARKLFTIDDLIDMHNKMHQLVAEVGGRIDMIFFCPHGPKDHCDCRKPKPGMLIDIARRYNASLDRTFVIGDSLHDLQAAITVKALPILVKTGKGKRVAGHLLEHGLGGTPTFENLSVAVDHLLDPK